VGATIASAKRFMGRAQVEAQAADELTPFHFAAGADGPVVYFQVSEDRRVTPMEVSAEVLKVLKARAEVALEGPLDGVVITVPAYFDDAQRQATKDAARLAGLTVLRLLNEPTSASLAYGLDKKRDGLFAVFDLGGGTFDISVIEIRDRVFEVKATGGDIFLGGVDFDNRIIEWVLESFQAIHPGVDLRRDPIAMQRIKDLAERSKIDLTDRKECAFNIPFITMTPEGQPLDVDLRFTREVLEARTHDLVTRCIDTCERVCRDARIDPRAIDHVLLVGGMTRMPLVQREVTAFFGRQPSKQVNPDEAVAIGAAMFAYSLEDNSNLKVQLLDVIPMAIGIENAAGDLHEIFMRNEAVPNLKQLSFTTSVDNQQDLRMRIYQGDEPIAPANELLGEFTFSGIRLAPAGSVRVQVDFSLSQDGILTMSAKDKDTGVEMKTSVHLGARAAEQR
ncbi:MAG: Hsp70 family protein, partial [Myxococcales bacterium]|nr:Hsp70 family protein [Myxococcales bacterium]